MQIENYAIEITRQCNIKCEHCLRGDAEGFKFNPDFLDVFIKTNNIVRIGGLLISGGEPSLNATGISDVIDVLIDNKVELGWFYIATNGTATGIAAENFVISCLRLYILSEEKDMCSVILSNDNFHKDEVEQKAELLEGLSFYSKKYKSPNYYHETALAMGRAEFWNNNIVYPDIFSIDGDYISDGTLYLNCKGNVIAGCNYSYTEQDTNKDIVICGFNQKVLEHINKFKKEI